MCIQDINKLELKNLNPFRQLAEFSKYIICVLAHIHLKITAAYRRCHTNGSKTGPTVIDIVTKMNIKNSALQPGYHWMLAVSINENTASDN
jgi:hypothetical protein